MSTHLSKGKNMERRNFIHLAVAGSVAGIIAPSSVLAGSSSMAGGLYYTKSAPGRWNKKVAGHLPSIEVSKNSDGVNIQVVTAHGMTGYEHYIVKHIVLDDNFNFIAEKMFDPMKDKAAMSEFSLGKYRGVVNVLSVCNKHDTWLNVARV